MHNFSQVRCLYPAQKARHGRPNPRANGTGHTLRIPKFEALGGGYLQERCFTVSACEGLI